MSKDLEYQAYKLAEERVTKAIETGATELSLSPHWTEAGSPKSNATPILAHLQFLPPAIARLSKLSQLHLEGTEFSDITFLSALESLALLNLIGTNVADLTPLANLKAMLGLFLNRSQVTDLSPLVAQGAAWENEDHAFETLSAGNIPLHDKDLATILQDNTFDGAPTILARLRELRDAQAQVPPDQGDAAPEVAEGGDQRLTIKDLTTLSTDQEQEDLKAEVIDALGVLIGHLEGSNQFAGLADRAQRYRAMLLRDTAKIGARAVWAIANAVRNAREAHLQAEEDGRLNECLPAAAAGEIATVVEVGGLWLMGHPGVAEAERQAAEYLKGPRDAQKIATTEHVIEALEADDALDEPSRDFAHDLLDAAKSGLEAGRRATFVVAGLGYNIGAFMLRSLWSVTKGTVAGTVLLEPLTKGSAIAARFVLNHTDTMRALVMEHMPSYAPWLEKIIEGLKALS